MVARKRSLAASRYVPDRGDTVWLVFDPQASHEQAGRRPALVLSPRAYNVRVGLALVCPITTRAKGYPFEVGLPEGSAVQGAILADQIKSLDWRTRQARKVGTVTARVLEDVVAKIEVLLRG